MLEAGEVKFAYERKTGYGRTDQPTDGGQPTDGPTDNISRVYQIICTLVRWHIGTTDDVFTFADKVCIYLSLRPLHIDRGRDSKCAVEQISQC